MGHKGYIEHTAVYGSRGQGLGPEKREKMCRKTGRSLNPIILIIYANLHFKSRQRKVMQEDLSNYFNQSLDQVSTKFIVISTLFDTVQAIFEITRVHPLYTV